MITDDSIPNPKANDAPLHTCARFEAYYLLVSRLAKAWLKVHETEFSVYTRNGACKWAKFCDQYAEVGKMALVGEPGPGHPGRLHPEGEGYRRRNTESSFATTEGFSRTSFNIALLIPSVKVLKPSLISSCIFPAQVSATAQGQLASSHSGTLCYAQKELPLSQLFPKRPTGTIWGALLSRSAQMSKLLASGSPYTIPLVGSEEYRAWHFASKRYLFSAR